MSSRSKQESKDEHPLLQRHYSTIGIGDVFLNAAGPVAGAAAGKDPARPPCCWLPSSYLNNNTSSSILDQEPMLLWEMVGSIKAKAEDFVVREMAVVKTASNKEEMMTADLNLPSELAEQVDQISKVADSFYPTAAKRQPANDPPGHKVDDANDEEVLNKNKNESSSCPTTSSSTATSEKEDPIARLKSVLSKHVQNIDHKKQSPPTILESLQELNQQALDAIERASNSNCEEADNGVPSCVANDVFISILSSNDKDSKTERQQKIQKEDRGEIHEAVRHAFPLLKSEPATDQSNNNDNYYTIRVTADSYFWELAPYLYDPAADLPHLYGYLKRGYEHAQQQAATEAISSKPSSGKSPSKRGRRRGGRGSSSSDRNVSRLGGPILRLKPDLPRSQRQPVHQFIESKTKAMLGTSTITEYPLHPQQPSIDGKPASQEASSETTAAIEVRWTKSAHRKVQSKKRKRETTQTNVPLSQEHTLCVVRKREVEHLSLINALASTLRCRPAAIGLAGIKDMHAVTYQFCTLQNVSPNRIRTSNTQLNPRGIEIRPLRMADRSLRKGDLVGNRFEIMIRNLKRVQLACSNGTVKEQFVPVEESHVEAMVERIRRSGFVNFFGEQRVGDPGLETIVGSRAFDIGRAMLQQHFSKAIDLLMTGRRLINNGSQREGDDFRLFRKTWKESGGDPTATLKNLPGGNSSLPRERMVLKGLKRYGSNNPLAALKCLQYNERIFFINAYQSYVWNLAASQRLLQYGTEVVVGDLVRREDTDEVEVATADDLPRLTIENVVLPLPGYSVLYPENKIGEYYQDVLMRENVQFKKEAPEEATAKGSYRRIVAVACNVEYAKCRFGETSNVKISFDLPKGSYATMLLRELMLTTVVREVTASS